ncbi:hypothetical protein [Pseudomonas bubulae]|uniref:hypothetical protein n=1 Tax=Pseudomonas bubulae TaxID=2316085 RepID=UPI001F41EC7D|nr:hypothetical protein [Pseudomonas bubulae]MCF3194131.1 hypothetical protein [Pseudomonas bubulae]
MPAGDNEKKFKDFVANKFGNSALGGKRTYSSVFDGYEEKVSISVDQSIFLDDTSILIEIDSGNYAKLLVGQYALLNGMYNGDHSGTLFLVVHCYKSTTKGETKEYSPVRTMKNLNAIQKLNPQMVWMPHAAVTLSQFESIVSMADSVEELSASLWGLAGRQMLFSSAK